MSNKLKQMGDKGLLLFGLNVKNISKANGYVTSLLFIKKERERTKFGSE